jgi:hypothetical protein
LILKAFFKFFREYLFYIEINIKHKSSKPEFLLKMSEILSSIGGPLSLVILKSIYSVGDKKLKLAVLRAMHSIDEFDRGFLFKTLKTKDLHLKSEALALLMRCEETREAALQKVLDFESPYGIKNQRLIRQMQMIERKNLTPAKQHLRRLSKRGGFWNRKLRAEAARILEEWDEG